MNGLNANLENGRIGPEQKLDSVPATLNIKVAHGLNQHDVAVPSNSTFGDLKSVLVQKIGLKPETHKILFRGKEKEDDEFLLTAGVKDNCKVLLMEDTKWQKGPEEVRETSVISRGGAAVAEIREEVDKLADQVAALQAVVDRGTKVDNKDIVYLTEMLMRQLIKLDGIEAEGEGKVQRKMEVRRVQSFVETMDILKSRNSNLFSSVNSTVPVTTQWETFETAFGTPPSPAPAPAPSPSPSPSPALMPSSSPTAPHVRSSIHNPSPMPSSTHVPSSIHNHPSPMPSSTPIPIPMPSLTHNPSPMSSSTPTPIPVPSSTPAPIPGPTYISTPVPFSVPLSNSFPISTPSPMPSSTEVTQEWEHFD